MDHPRQSGLEAHFIANMNTNVILNRGFTLPFPRRARSGQGTSALNERAYRKALRAAELAVWNAADRTSPVIARRPRNSEDRSESMIYLVVAAAVVVALVLAALATSDWPSSSEGLRGLLVSLGA